MQKSLRFPCIVAIAAALMLAACSPKFDWRVVRGSAVPFEVLLPAKPATLAQPVNLDGVKVEMTMTAAEVDGITFAVGATTLPDAAAAPAALAAMKTALVRNINGSVKREAGEAARAGMLEVEAVGTRAPNGPEVLLLAKFIARDARVYQVVVLGPSHKLVREEAENFFTSFKPE